MEKGCGKDRDDMMSKAMSPTKMRASRLKAMMLHKKGSKKK